MKRNNTKGFSLIELIVVMAIMAILVLIASQKFFNVTHDAKLTHIQHDVKIASNKASEYAIKNNDELPIGTQNISGGAVSSANNGTLYNEQGIVIDFNVADNYYAINKDFISGDVGSKLSGTFITNSNGDVYYSDEEMYPSAIQGSTYTENISGVDWLAVGEADGSVNVRLVNPPAVSGIIAVPSAVDGYKVTVIDFAGLCGSNPTSITLPNTLTTIRQMAFGYLTSLTSIEFPDSLTEIQGTAFVGCNGLTSITIKGKNLIIGDAAFNACMSLDNVKIESTNTSIGFRTFSTCRNLKTVNVTGSLTSIGGAAFEQDYLLTFKVPAGTTSIGASAFYGCTELTKLEVPTSVITFGNSFVDNTTTVYGETGSAAETYCLANGISFIVQ